MTDSTSVLASTAFAIVAVAGILRSRREAKASHSSPRPTDRSWTLILSGVAAFLAFWFLVSAFRTVGITRVPSPFATAVALGELVFNGTLLVNIFVSIGRIVVGFTGAAIIGVSLGWLAGTFLLFNQLVLPINSFLRYIPPTAFVTLLIVYFGIGDTYKYAVVFVSVVFFIVQMTVDAVEDIDHRYREMGRISGMNSMGIMHYVIVPGTLPRIVDLLRVNLSGAWTFLVAAEVIGADGGIGHLIAVSQRFGRIEDLYAAIVTFGFIGILTDWLFKIFSLRTFRWAR